MMAVKSLTLETGRPSTTAMPTKQGSGTGLQWEYYRLGNQF